MAASKSATVSLHERMNSGLAGLSDVSVREETRRLDRLNEGLTAIRIRLETVARKMAETSAELATDDRETKEISPLQAFVTEQANELESLRNRLLESQRKYDQDSSLWEEKLVKELELKSTLSDKEVNSLVKQLEEARKKYLASSEQWLESERKLKADIDSLNHEMIQNKNAAEERDNIRRKHNEEMAIWKENLASLESDYKGLEKISSDAEKRHKGEISILNGELEDLKSNKEKWISKEKKLTADNELLKQELMDTRNRAAAGSEVAADLEETSRKYREKELQVSTLKQELELKENESIEWQREKTKLMDTINTHESSLDRIKKEYTEKSSGEVLGLQNEITSLKSKLDTLKRESKEKTETDVEKINELQDQLNVLQGQHSALDLAYSNAEQSNEFHQSRIEGLEKQAKIDAAEIERLKIALTQVGETVSEEKQPEPTLDPVQVEKQKVEEAKLKEEEAVKKAAMKEKKARRNKWAAKAKEAKKAAQDV